MIPLLAKNAVSIKCKYNDAGLTGNYECAYSLGIIAALTGQEELNEINDFEETKKEIMSKAGEYTGDNLRIKRLYELVNDYEPGQVNDGQILELYRMGYHDKSI